VQLPRKEHIMNNYGRNQMNNRSRQGNMQYNRMNRNNCGCDNNVRPVDNCGCNTPVRPVDNCGCNTPARPADNCGCNNARPADNCGCDHDHHDHHHHDHDHHTNCGIDHGTEGCNASRYDQLSGMALAMSYVPWQTFCKRYELEEALCQGTIFKELDLDFMRGCRS